jgi:hypothetical protein
MSHRVTAWLAWSVCGLSLVLVTLSLGFLALNLAPPVVHVFDYWPEITVMTVTFSTVGAFIAARRPEHPVGWLFCLLGFLSGVDHLCAEYATFALLEQPGALPAGGAAAWVRGWIWGAYLGLGMFLVLLFPNGRLPSSRWRPFAWLSAATALLATVALAFAPGPVDGLGPIENPLGVALLGIGGEGGVIALVEAVYFVGLGGLAAASVLVRLRHSTGVERQQVKWFVYAEVVLVIGNILSYTVPDISAVPWWGRWGAFVLTMVGAAGLPVSVAIAVLRYRLYEIDYLINRTLVYASLTAMLAVVYFGSVTATLAIFRALTGQEKQSQVAIAVSTLVIATLFNPLRRRIQTFIDRRFYRRKYDARKTLEAFSAKLRDETDLDALSDDLVSVVSETMQPAHVSLWLRPDTPPKGQEAD